MTVDAALIARISPFTVAADGDFTEDDLTAYVAIATAQFNREDPGLDSILADYAKGLLVCHIFESSKNKRSMKSEKIGDYSYTKEEATATSFLLDYEQLLASYGGEAASEGIERTDKDLPSQFDLDQGEMPEFY